MAKRKQRATNGAKATSKDLPRHETELVPVKAANVDRAIVPLVAWLNSFPGVHTLYSCEGWDDADYEGTESSKSPWTGNPYVSFLCSDLLTLRIVLSRLRINDGYAVTCEVDAKDGGELRYTLRFADKDHLRRVIEDISLSRLPYELRMTNPLAESLSFADAVEKIAKHGRSIV